MNKGTVLIVEDAFCLRDASRTLLEGHGYNVLEASNGVEALEVLTKFNAVPHTILLDLKMPLMDGHEFLEKIPLLPSCENIEIVLFTGYPEEVSNPFRTLLKPSDLEEILSAVEVGYLKTLQIIP